MITVNGQQTAADGMTIADCLRSAGYDLSRVAVEKNGTIVPRSEYSAVTLRDGDSLEIVRFVGGG